MNCNWYCSLLMICKKKFEDTKGIFRICKSKKDRQYNGQKIFTHDNVYCQVTHMILKMFVDFCVYLWEAMLTLTW
jgi:hypothetical protein